MVASGGAPAIWTQGLWHRYGQRVALENLDLEVERGAIFGLLGPNGGGKTTLFRLLTTYCSVQTGQIRVLGLDPLVDPLGVRRRIGVVFQHPSLDDKLTVGENLRHHARLYGLSRADATRREREMLEALGVWDRRGDLVGRLSGGLARRVELAKGLLHQPELLILDEPSTGLDPGARRDLWRILRSLGAAGVTVLVTTHLMEEAADCDRIGIIDRGRLVAHGTPEELRAEIGGAIVVMVSREPERLAARLQEALGITATVEADRVSFESAAGYANVPKLAEAAGDLVESLSISRPSLEDVFLQRTGHRFWSEGGDA